MNHATINSGLLRWARERRNLSYSDLARSLHVGIEVVRTWELGESYPPFAKAQALAKRLRIPFGFLFLSEPPKEDVPLPDFRTINNRTPSMPSPDFQEVCNQVLRKQEWYREYSEQISAQKLDLIGRYRIDSGAERVANGIKESLGIDAELRANCRDWSSYLTRLSHIAQDRGVLVMRSGVVGSDTTRPLDVAEFRGFAIADPLAPVIFINSRDAIAAQIFTLVHEITHLSLGQSGISNPDPTELAPPPFEQFCNTVAAEVLAPKGDFDAAWETTPHGDSFLVSLARVFWVSTLVILRRAYELDKLKREEFFRLVKLEKEKQLPRRKGKGGNYLTSMLARNSQRLTSGVLGALRENQLVYRDAANLLGIQAAKLPKLLRKQLG
jgi:Zn-dependent peptidase ImmA (M78 family)/transcriptional regulator with XRE-family HTH domain